MPPRRRSHRPVETGADRAAWRVLRTILWTTVIAVGVFGSVILVRLLNSEADVKRCVNIRRFDVRPDVPDLPDGASEPVAFGYFYTNTQQRFVRWRIADAYNPNGVEVTGFSLNGPLSPQEPDVAPVALELSAGVNRGYFVGNSTIDARLLIQVQNDPSSFYLAFYGGLNTERTEIGRDYLNKLC